MHVAGTAPWLGIVDAQLEGTFVTVTGEPLLANQFAIGQPDGGLNQACVCLRENAGWRDFPCSGQGDTIPITALCELPPVGRSFCGDGVVQPGLGEACDPGLSACAADCGSATNTTAAFAQGPASVILAFAEVRTFSSALGSCQALGGELAMPTSAAENVAVDQLRSRVTAGGAWIGFSDQVTEVNDNDAGFQRVDTGQPIGPSGFTAFDFNQPDNARGDQDCVEMKPAGVWNDESCGPDRSFICQL